MMPDFRKQGNPVLGAPRSWTRVWRYAPIALGGLGGFTGMIGLPLPVAVAAPAPSVHAACLPPAGPLGIPVLARRQGRDGCWVRYDGICVSRSLWLKILRAEAPRCGTWEGKWRTSAPFDNSGHDAITAETKVSSISFSATAAASRAPNRGSPFPAPAGVAAARFWISESVWPALRRIERLREWASTALAPQDPLGIARHLLLNELRRGEPGEVLRLLGFVHVLTATGIHLYALASWSSRIAGGLLAITPLPASMALSAALIIRRALVFCLWLLAWLLAGGRAGMLRPWIVVLLRLGGQRLGIRWRRWSPLVLALLVDLSIALYHALTHQPGAWAPGRWMYALAVGGGLMSQESSREAAGPAGSQGSGDSRANHGSRERPSHWRQHLALAVGSWVFVALWEAAHLGLVAPLTPLLSMLTLPLFCVGVFPLFLLALLLRLLATPGAGEALLARTSEALHWAFVPVIELTLRLPSLWVVSLPSLAAGAALCAVTLAVGAGLPHRRQAGFVLLLLAAVLGIAGAATPSGRKALPTEASARQDVPPKADRITLLDIGQGDAALIEYRDEIGQRRVGLIDTGPENALTEAGWIQLLARRGITRLDWIALTHLDADHTGALGRLQRLVPVDCVVSGAAQLRGARLERLLERLPRGTSHPEGWRPDCVPFPAYTTTERRARGKIAARLAGNGNMTVLWIPLRGGGGFLDTGDLDGSEELTILSWLRPWLHKHREGYPLLLKVSHHGSAHSTSAAFLAAVQPTEAWTSVGYGNRYGHPAPETVERLENARIPTRRTDREGALEWSGR